MSTNPNMKQSCSITAEHQVLVLLLRRECRYLYILLGAKMKVIPARSPDLNPTENLFNIVCKCIEAEILEQNIIHQSWDEFVQRVKFHVRLVSQQKELKMLFITYLLKPRETVCFVDPRPSMLPQAKPRETSMVEGPQNTLLSRGLSK